MDAIAKFAYPLAAIALAFGLSACGDDITEINANVGAVKSSDDLPACTEDIVGQTAYIKETHEFLGCDGKEWQALSANTVNVGDNVCTSTSLSDGTGFEIFCNGESIGTVKNGKDGADGKDGAKGDPGEAGKDGAPGAKGEKGDDGAPGTNGTNGKDGAPGTDGKDGANGTGCVIKESTALTATIACGSETFTMDLTGYVDVPEECDPTDSACTVPEGEVQLGGVSQKGPFVSGTDVTAYELENGKSLKQTGKTFGGKIENKDGSFNIRTVKLRSTYTYLVADGFYRNEVTGKNSAATIKLRALTNLDGRRTANINLVTHLEYDRVQRLVTKENMSVPAAKRAAEREIFTAFGIDGDGFKGYAEDFNILKEGEGNGELLAISAMLQGDRNESELTALLAALSVDLGDNGVWDDSLRRAQVADWAMKTDLDGRLATIRANVEGWKLAESAAPAFEQHVTNFWMQELGAGECTVDNEGALFAVKNNHSAYYAANDSAYTDGDSSLVRLICAASGDSFAWRFATDSEKDVAALAGDADEGSAANGKINTSFVYVKENGDWRRGTELDASLDAACVADNKGMTDSLIVKHEPVWYICDKDDAASDSYAWREATTTEADTALFGTPGEGDPIVRIGNVNKSHYYVFEDNKWRFGTAEDIVEGLGACTESNLGKVRQMAYATGTKNGWYRCSNDKAVTVEGVLVINSWREATDFEKDTVGWNLNAPSSDTVRAGTVNNDIYYVYDISANKWRRGNSLDNDSELGPCTKAKLNKVATSVDGNSYKCAANNAVDANLQPYSWRPATNVEVNTWSLSCWWPNYVHRGLVDRDMFFVCTNVSDEAWREMTIAEMDTLGIGISTDKYKLSRVTKTWYRNGMVVSPDEQDFITSVKSAVVELNSDKDTIQYLVGEAYSSPQDGQLITGYITSNVYTYDSWQDKWRYLSVPSQRTLAQGIGAGCTKKMANTGYGSDGTKYLYPKGVVKQDSTTSKWYLCKYNEKTDDYVWTVASAARWQTYGNMCFKNTRDAYTGKMANENVYAYVCDADTFRTLTRSEQWALDNNKDGSTMNIRCSKDDENSTIVAKNVLTKFVCKNGLYVWNGESKYFHNSLAISEGSGRSWYGSAVGISNLIWTAENVHWEWPTSSGPYLVSSVVDGDTSVVTTYFNRDLGTSKCAEITSEDYSWDDFHLASYDEWEQLYGQDVKEPLKLKSVSKWKNAPGTNSSFFGMEPSGNTYWTTGNAFMWYGSSSRPTSVGSVSLIESSALFLTRDGNYHILYNEEHNTFSDVSASKVKWGAIRCVSVGVPAPPTRN